MNFRNVTLWGWGGLLSCLSVVCKSAAALPPPFLKIEIVQVREQGKPNAKRGEVLEVWRDVVEQMAVGGVRLKLTRIASVIDPRPELGTVEGTYGGGRIAQFRGRARDAVARGADAVVVVVPPMSGPGGKLFFGGRAFRIGGRGTDKAIALCTVAMTRSNGTSGREFSSVSCAHELAHVLGARHVESETLMHAAALAVMRSAPMPIDSQTIEEIGGAKS